MEPIINPWVFYLIGVVAKMGKGLVVFMAACVGVFLKKREKRTARISLLLKTSTANKLRERAAAAGTTLNDYLNLYLMN